MKTSLKHFMSGLIVSALVASFVGVGGLAWLRHRQDQSARCQTTRTSIGVIVQALQLFAGAHDGAFPPSLDEMIPARDDECVCFGRTLCDSWGTAFDYRSDGRTFSIRSAGPDMKLGTKDDITN